MPLIRSTLIGIGLFLCTNVAQAQLQASDDRLFDGDDMLAVRIAAPLKSLLAERPLDDEYPATFVYTDQAGVSKTHDLQIRTRGRYRHRRDICRFPPMRLNFKKSAVAGSLLHDQDKLKLVTHCQSASKYEQTVIREFLAYRILNELTEQSFRVRLLQITWVDTERANRETTKYGFVIEHRDQVSKRIGQPLTKTPKVTIGQMDPAHTNLGSVFQYLIGNTDFSPIKGPPNEDCCHNYVLFGDLSSTLVSIPYDFDQSGIVNAAHAAPNPRFGLRNVRQRLYRGRCALTEQLPATIELFQAKRASLYALAESLPQADNRTKKYVADYLDDFYKVLDSKQRVESQLIKECI